MQMVKGRGGAPGTIIRFAERKLVFLAVFPSAPERNGRVYQLL